MALRLSALALAACLHGGEGESTYAGDRDVRFVNCAVPCEFECGRPEVPAWRLMSHAQVLAVRRETGMHGQQFDLLPSGKQDYERRLRAALRRALAGVREGRQPPAETPARRPLPLALRLTRWDCDEDCRYSCMIENRELRRAGGEQQVHYVGKWPFTRVFGIQELFSSLFSLLNGLPHLLLLFRLRPGRSSLVTRSVPVWRLLETVNVNTWLQSALFHARESKITEALDYHSASLHLATTLGAALFAQLPERWSTRRAAAGAFLLPWLAWASLVGYISFVNFDYGFFMSCSVAMGVCSSVSWIVWSLRPSKGRRRPFAWKVIVTALGIYVVLPLELLDFPPLLGLLDAHALWHLLTVPLQILFCDFVRESVAFELADVEKRKA